MIHKFKLLGFKVTVSQTLEDKDWTSAIKTQLTHAAEKLENKFGLYSMKTTEVAQNSRSMFVPVCDGGVELVGFTDIATLKDFGNFPKDATVQQYIKRKQSENESVIREKYKTNHKVAMKGILEEDITYENLIKLGKSEWAEKFNKESMELGSQDTLLIQLGVYYFNTENKANRADKDVLYCSGIINWRTPYHKSNQRDEKVIKTSTFQPVDSTMKEALEQKLTMIVNAF